MVVTDFIKYLIYKGFIMDMWEAKANKGFALEIAKEKGISLEEAHLILQERIKKTTQEGFFEGLFRKIFG